MPFRTDGGGFAFSAGDAKLAYGSATWITHLSQLGRMKGRVCIMARLLPDVKFIGEIVGKRPWDISILAHVDAVENARLLKSTFPRLKIALHPRNNTKMVLVAPDTVWISSADFGESRDLETGIGLHSTEAFNAALNDVFERAWKEAQVIWSRRQI